MRIYLTESKYVWTFSKSDKLWKKCQSRHLQPTYTSKIWRVIVLKTPDLKIYKLRSSASKRDLTILKIFRFLNFFSIRQLWALISPSFIRRLFWNFRSDNMPRYVVVSYFSWWKSRLLLSGGFSFNDELQSLIDGLLWKLMHWNGARHISFVI